MFEERHELGGVDPRDYRDRADRYCGADFDVGGKGTRHAVAGNHEELP